MTTIGGVEVSHPDKPLFPHGMTKADLARYYERVAPTMLPLVRGRPVHMQRFPDGIEGEQIQQKQAPAHFPGFVARAQVERKRGGSIEQVVIDNRETLVYLADQACVTPHVWLSRVDLPDRPDRLIFDLDPSRPDLAALRSGARRLRELLDELGLDPHLMTTGSRGYHVVAPLDREAGFEESRAFARSVARMLADREPLRFTVEQRKRNRGDRIYLDVGRNSYAQTGVAPYAVRGLPGAPVATPLEWDELSRAEPRRFTAHNLFRRLARKQDPWAEIDRRAGSIAAASARLHELHGRPPATERGDLPPMRAAR
ncbi:MAG: non-homologous end-joining DNA ligase [Solirubrobacterales bacterium]